MLPVTCFVFDRQRIVVAGEDSATVAFAVAILRGDGHCVTQVTEVPAASWGLALRDCHLLVLGGTVSGSTPWADFQDELRDRHPALSLLCLSDASWSSPPSRVAAQPSPPTLRSPFTAEELRAAVRPLLPKLHLGSVLARAAQPAPVPATGG